MTAILGKNGEIHSEVSEYDRYKAFILWQACPGGTHVHAQITDLKLEGEEIGTQPRRGCILGCPPKVRDVRKVWQELVDRARQEGWGVPTCLETVIGMMESTLRENGI